MAPEWKLAIRAGGWGVPAMGRACSSLCWRTTPSCVETVQGNALALDDLAARACARSRDALRATPGGGLYRLPFI